MLDELGKVCLVDVVLPRRQGIEIRRWVCRPDDHQQILLGHLGLMLPRRLKVIDWNL